MLFPLFYEVTFDSIKQIDPNLIDVLKLDETHHLSSIRYVYLPSIKEQLFITVFQSLGLGLKVLVMSEYLYMLGLFYSLSSLYPLNMSHVY